MYKIEMPAIIQHAIMIFIQLRMWSIKDGTTFRRSGPELFYFIYFVSFTMSVVLRALTTDDKDECVFLTVVTIICVVQSYRLWCILRKRSVIFALVHKIGTHYINDRKVFILVDKQIKMLTKFTQFFMIVAFAAFMFALIEPIANEKRLFLNIAFPFDRSNSETVFWIEFLFIACGMFLSVVGCLFTIIIWYLMQSLVLKYNVLGKQLENMGGNLSKAGQQKCYLQDFITAIKTYEQINGYSTFTWRGGTYKKLIISVFNILECLRILHRIFRVCFSYKLRPVVLAYADQFILWPL